MTTISTSPRVEPRHDSHGPPGSWLGWWWSALQLVLALLLTLAALVLLLWSPFGRPAPLATEPSASADAVRLDESGLLRIAPDTPLGKKLEIAEVTREKISAPLLTVAGSVVARLRPGPGPAEDRWQFSTPELLGAYTDWRKSNADVTFAEKQLTDIRELNEARVSAQEKVVERLEKLVKIGTDAPKDLAAEEANLRQARIQGRKEVFEAETNVRVADRSRAALERQLFQAGADPHLLGRAPEGTDVVMADVPEARVGLVREGQECRARFYGYPDTPFMGRVASLAPTISKERRTLRVQFEVSDPDDRLKPGMFADIGLGTDARETLVVPADGVLHSGRSDYVLVRTAEGAWRVTEVRVGDLHAGGRVEVLGGLTEGDRVIGKGAILLKPFVVQSAQRGPTTTNPTGEKSGS
jgi:membrane fusion protein, heavy metal efflux system